MKNSMTVPLYVGESFGGAEFQWKGFGGLRAWREAARIWRAGYPSIAVAELVSWAMACASAAVFLGLRGFGIWIQSRAWERLSDDELERVSAAQYRNDDQGGRADQRASDVIDPTKEGRHGARAYSISTND